MYNNYPNPFNNSTTIHYRVSRQQTARVHVELDVYNLLGQKVAVLVNKKQAAGDYRVSYNTGNLASGIYFYQIKIGEFTKTKKMVLIK